MRAWVIIAYISMLLCAGFGFVEIDTALVTAGDNISIENESLTVEFTFNESVNFRWQGFGFILEELECRQLQDTIHRICVDATTESSATVLVSKLLYNLTVAQSVVEDVDIGDDMLVEINITSNLPQSEYITAVITTNATVTDFGVIPQSLIWEGLMTSETTQRLKYTATATAEGDVFFAVNISGGGFTNSTNSTTTISDFIEVETEYETEITKEKAYNFSMSIQNTETQDTELDITITFPENLTILDKGTLSNSSEGKLVGISYLNSTNNSVDEWFTYTARKNMNGEFAATVETIVNSTTVQRLYTYPVQTSDFKHPVLVQSIEGKIYNVGEKSTLQLQLLNTNNVSLSVAIDASSALVNHSQTHTLEAENTTVVNLEIFPTVASEYGINVEITYNDFFSEEFTIEEFIKFKTVGEMEEITEKTEGIDNQAEEEIVEQEKYDVQLVLPTILGESESTTLEVLLDTNTTVNVTISKDDEILFNEQTNSFPVTLEVTGPGVYLVELVDALGMKGEAFIVVKAPEIPEEEIEEEIVKTVEKKSILGAVLPPIGLLLGIVVVLLAALFLVKHHIEHKEQELFEQQKQVMNMVVQSPEQYQLKLQLEQEIIKKIDALERVLAILRRKR